MGYLGDIHSAKKEVARPYDKGKTYYVEPVQKRCRYCRKPIKPEDVYVKVGWDYYHEWCWHKLHERLKLPQALRMFAGMRGTAIIQTREGKVIRVSRALAHALQMLGYACIIKEEVPAGAGLE